eukprot:gene11826-biopygen6300
MRVANACARRSAKLRVTATRGQVAVCDWAQLEWAVEAGWTRDGGSDYYATVTVFANTRPSTFAHLSSGLRQPKGEELPASEGSYHDRIWPPPQREIISGGLALRASPPLSKVVGFLLWGSTT